MIARPPVKMVVKNGIGARTEALRKAQERANPRYPGLNWQRMFFNRKGQVKITPALYPADIPRILFIKHQSAEYQPIAQQAWLGVAHDAAKLLRPTLDADSDSFRPGIPI